ncbi:MAG: hypothetical protein NZL99_02625 [Burkholderiaceae bacterium]|nr:hypothetical protein [Burkholderiaceae bacterium]
MKRLLLGVMLLAAVAGCGGGDGDSAPPQSPAQGFWTGSTGNGYSMLGAVLENGDYWFLYYYGNVVYGLVQGSSSAASGNFSSANGLDFYMPYGAVYPVTIAGSYRERQSLQGHVRYQNGAVVTFSGTYDARYEAPATPAAIAGRWRGQLDTGETFVIDVAANGALSGASAFGCTFGGSAVPRPSGKAVYDVSVRFNGGNCLLGTQTITGIGAVIGSGASAVLYAAALNAPRNAGFVVSARR